MTNMIDIALGNNTSSVYQKFIMSVKVSYLTWRKEANWLIKVAA